MQVDDEGKRSGPARLIDSCEQRFVAVAKILDIVDIDFVTREYGCVHVLVLLLVIS
jgi:hypothetical protein